MTFAAPPELLPLPVLALAAGLDLYLTLLFLGIAPALGLWPPLPGALADLASPGVLLLAGAFYLAELAAERAFTPALVWNGLHAIIRPLAGLLLALLLLDGSSAGLLVGGAVASAGLASSAHAVATGGLLLLRLERAPAARPLFASLLEDAAVVGLLSLSLDRPAWAAALAVTATLAGLPLAGSQLRAFRFSVRLVLGRARGLLTGGGWTPREELPGWLREMMDGDAAVPHRLRGTPAAALRLPGRPRLVRGWLVVRGDRRLFVHGATPGAWLDLEEHPPRALRDEGFLRLAELAATPSPGDPPGADEGSSASRPVLLLTRDGPSLGLLREELGADSGGGSG